MLRCHWLALALALVGCSSHGAPPPADSGIGMVSYSCSVTSGSRLRANYWVTADGGRYFAGTWHDAMLDHDCAVGSIPGDSNVYCLPTSDGISSSEYSDDQCTSPVAYVDPTCSPSSPIFGFKSETGTGGYALTFYPIAGAYTGTRWAQNGGCRAATDQPPAGYEVHSVGTALDPTSFATVTPYTAMGPTRLQATGYTSPDGAIQACSANAFFDSQRNEKCFVGADSMTQVRCLPLGYSFTGTTLYSDTSCKNPAEQLSANPALPYEAVSVAFTCGTGTKLFKLAGPVTSEYTIASGSCASVSPTLPDYYTAGDEVTPDHFVALTDVPRVVDGQRLQEVLHGTADGFGMATGTFIDPQLGGATCQFTTASDGTTRCLPGDPSNVPKIGFLYSDATCLTPISIIVPDCTGIPPRYAQLVDTPPMHATCSYQGATHVYAVGGAVEDVLYEDSGGACTESAYTGNAYALSPELPPSMFVQATLASE